MGNYAQDHVRVTENDEIKAPLLADPRLPDIPTLVIFLGPQRWVSQVLQEQPDLLIESPSDGLGRPSIVLHRSRRKAGIHLDLDRVALLFGALDFLT